MSNVGGLVPFFFFDGVGGLVPDVAVNSNILLLEVLEVYSKET